MYNQVSIIKNHIYKIVDMGVDFFEICRRMKIKPELLNNGEAYLDYQPGEETDFWTHALELTGDPQLGLHLGQRPDRYRAFGILALLALSCKNIREAMELVCRYSNTLSDVFTHSFETTNDTGIFYFQPHTIWEETNLESARQAVDLSVSGWLSAIHEVSIRKIYPLRLELKYSKRFVKEYEDIIHAPVLFNQPTNCYVFSKADLETPIISYDQSMHATFDALLKKKQSQLDSNKTVAGQVRHQLITNFHGQTPSIDIIASTLCMATRTLQRKLLEEKTSYREVANSLRKELADDLIRSGVPKKGEIATLLGYSDVSTLNKAMKSWK